MRNAIYALTGGGQEHRGGIRHLHRQITLRPSTLHLRGLKDSVIAAKRLLFLAIRT